MRLEVSGLDDQYNFENLAHWRRNDLRDDIEPLTRLDRLRPFQPKVSVHNRWLLDDKRVTKVDSRTKAIAQMGYDLPVAARFLEES